MNELPKGAQNAIKELLLCGNSVRGIASALGVSRQTVVRYAKAFCVRAKCGCGEQAGHRGWCWYRFQFSPARQGWIADSWEKRSDDPIHTAVADSAREAYLLGHRVGAYVWGSPFAANLAHAKCAECGAYVFIKRDGRYEGRLVECECLSADVRQIQQREREEKRQWQDAKRTLGEVKRLLRSRSRSAESTQALSSRR
jgi:hypothetical protein